MAARRVDEVVSSVSRATSFAKGKAESDFTHVPLTPVDVKHAETITKMDKCVLNLGSEEAIQKSGMFGQKTEEQQSDRGDVESILRKVNTTVAAHMGSAGGRWQHLPLKQSPAGIYTKGVTVGDRTLSG